MGQCSTGCFTGTVQALIAPPAQTPGRRVGLERKYARRLRQSGNVEQVLLRQEGVNKDFLLTQQQRPVCGSPRRARGARTNPCAYLQDQSIDGENYHWEGNLCMGAKVSPACRSFGSEYSLTDTILGSGMSGAVVLATPRTPYRCMEFERVSEGSEPNTAAEGTQAPGESSSTLDAPFSRSSSSKVISRLSSMVEGRVAVKTLQKQGLAESDLKRLLMEVDIYLKMDHVNIAKLLRVYNEADSVYLVMEYCSGGSLCDKLLGQGPFIDKDAVTAIRQVLSAVNYCHCHPSGKVCHRDLKHSNFIYASEAEGAPLKLVDFGLSRVLRAHKQQISSYAGTLYYMAPEVVTRQSYDESCDLWSVGVIAYSLLCGEPPFSGSTDAGVAKAIAAANLHMESKVWSGVSEAAKDFCRHLLQLDPSARPSAEAALQHPWLLSHATSEFNAGKPEAPFPVSPDIMARIRSFAHESAVRRAAAALIIYSSTALNSADESARLLEAQFHALDSNGNGTISLSELEKALRESLGVTQQEAEWIFSKLDYDGDSELHHSEFLAAAMGTKLLCCAETVREAFRRFDLDSDGKIDRGELLAVLGPRFCGKPTEEIFDELDTNGDQAVDLDEFSTGIASARTTISAFQPELEPSPEARFDQVLVSGQFARTPEYHSEELPEALQNGEEEEQQAEQPTADIRQQTEETSEAKEEAEDDLQAKKASDCHQKRPDSTGKASSTSYPRPRRDTSCTRDGLGLPGVEREAGDDSCSSCSSRCSFSPIAASTPGRASGSRPAQKSQKPPSWALEEGARAEEEKEGEEEQEGGEQQQQQKQLEPTATVTAGAQQQQQQQPHPTVIMTPPPRPPPATTPPSRSPSQSPKLKVNVSLANIFGAAGTGSPGLEAQSGQSGTGAVGVGGAPGLGVGIETGVGAVGVVGSERREMCMCQLGSSECASPILSPLPLRARARSQKGRARSASPPSGAPALRDSSPSGDFEGRGGEDGGHDRETSGRASSKGQSGSGMDAAAAYLDALCLAQALSRASVRSMGASPMHDYALSPLRALKQHRAGPGQLLALRLALGASARPLPQFERKS